MQRLPVLLALFMFAACDMISGPETIQPVDVTNLAPLSGKEQALLAAGEGAERSGDPISAERDYAEAAAQSHGHIEAHLALANLYQSQNQLGKAGAVLERAQAYQPDHPRVNYLLGKLAIADNKPDEALTFFDRGLRSNPDDIDLLNGAGVTHDMLQQTTQAQALYKRAITLSTPSDAATTRTNLAMSYLLSNQPKKAAALLKPDAKKPEASPVTRANLALAYGLLGKTIEAKALTSGDMTEEERQLALKRLQLYIAQSGGAAPMKPAVAVH